MKNTERDISAPATKLSDEDIKKISDTLEEAGAATSKRDLLELEGEPNNSDINDMEELNEDSIQPGFTEIDEEALKELGLDNETIEEIKNNPDAMNFDDVEPSKENYLNAISSYIGLTDEDSMKLIEVIGEYRRNPKGKYYDMLPESAKKSVKDLKINIGRGATNDSVTRFLLNNFINDAQFEALLVGYQKDMSDVMSEMHNEFKSIVQESFDDLFSNIDKIKETNPDQAENLDKFYKSFKSATTFERQLNYIDNGLTRKKLNKWYNRFDDDAFYFNKRINTDANINRGIRFSDIRGCIPTIHRALDGFTERQIKEFILVFIRSIINDDFEDINTLFYIYGVISSIDSFKYSNDFDSDLGKELFGNIKKVIQKLNKLD